MTNYRDRPFAVRFSELGDTAEGVYLSVKPLGNTTRFGFRRPEGIKFSDVPPTMRHMPDFITTSYLVEVCGMGRDGILKSMKVSKFTALKAWNTFCNANEMLGVVLFIWNSHLHEFLIVGWDAIVKEVQYSKRKYGVQTFESDGNEYYRLDWDRLRKAAATVGTFNDIED